MQLLLQIRFLANSYHGREWPPAPMRLFQAFVAATGTMKTAQDTWPTETIHFFNDFEALEPPDIFAESIHPTSVYQTACPDNDEDIGMEAMYGNKVISDLEKKRKKRYSLKEIRRYLPTRPVYYLWKIPEQNPTFVRQLCRCAEQLTAVGLGIDFAMATVEHGTKLSLPDLPKWQATSNSGVRLRLPMAGTLNSLLEREQQRRTRMQNKFFVSSIPKYRELYYSHKDSKSRKSPWYLYTITTMDGRKPKAWQLGNGITLAAMVRHALLKCAGSDEQNFVSGHGKNGEQRISWIPLPSIGHEHADCNYRRVLILGSSGTNPDRIRKITYALHGKALQHHGKPVARIFETDRIDGAIHPFLDVGCEWITITPVILPGRTTKGGSQKGKLKPGKIDKLVRKSFLHAGYPEPKTIMVQQAPFHRNGNAARDYRVAKYMRFPRYHVRVIFEHPVQGPIITGTGRHYGIGLFQVVHNAAY